VAKNRHDESSPISRGELFLNQIARPISKLQDQISKAEFHFAMIVRAPEWWIGLTIEAKHPIFSNLIFFKIIAFFIFFSYNIMANDYRSSYRCKGPKGGEGNGSG
jgi:hypothetical protein